MYGVRYEVLLVLLLAVVLLVGTPLSIVLRRSGLAWWKILPLVVLSSLGVVVLSVIVSTVVTVRLAPDGASAPSPKRVGVPSSVSLEAGASPGLEMAREARMATRNPAT